MYMTHVESDKPGIYTLHIIMNSTLLVGPNILQRKGQAQLGITIHVWYQSDFCNNQNSDTNWTWTSAYTLHIYMNLTLLVGVDPLHLANHT